jgi:hypothetical protein
MLSGIKLKYAEVAEVRCSRDLAPGDGAWNGKFIRKHRPLDFAQDKTLTKQWRWVKILL